MHIDLSNENENAIRELSIKLNLSSAYIVNLLVKSACFEIFNDEVILKFGKDFIEKMRINLKLSE